MNTTNHALLAYLVTAIIVLCSTVIVMAGHTIPDIFQVLGGAAIGAAAGVSVPKSQ